MKSVKLVFWSVVVYAVLLLLVRGILPSDTLPAVSLAGIPLMVVALIIVRDLSRRSTDPSTTPKVRVNRGFKEDPVRFLGRQIGVATGASDSYFDNVVRSRLRELLISKVSVETGIDPVAIRAAMSDPKRGAELIHDKELYTSLYAHLPGTKEGLMRLVEDAIDMIGDWKS